jgi:hypothetical protein
MTKLHRAIVQLSEYGLYALLLVQPSTGMGATLFSGSRTMFNLKRGTVAAVAVSFALFTTLGTAVAGPATEANKDIAQMVRAGGFIIVVRHGATFPDRAATDPLNFGNVAAQRNLNDKGKVLAKAFGDAVRRVGIPVGKVYHQQVQPSV